MLPSPDMTEGEVLVKIGQHVIPGVLKSCGTIDEVCLQEKQFSKARKNEERLEAQNTIITASSSGRVVADGHVLGLQKKRSSSPSEFVEDPDSAAGSTLRKRMKISGTTLRTLPLATDNDVAGTPECVVGGVGEVAILKSQDKECIVEENELTSPKNLVEDVILHVVSAEHQGTQEEEEGSEQQPLNYGVKREETTRATEVKLQQLQNQVQLLTSKQMELLESKTSMELRINKLEALLQTGRDAPTHSRDVLSNDNAFHIPPPPVSHTQVVVVDGPSTNRPSARVSLGTQPTPKRSTKVRSHNSGMHKSLQSTPQTPYTLWPIEEVVAKYSELHKPESITRLAVKLAREAVFGPDVLAQCTPLGHTQFQALPVAGLQKIKETLKLLCVWNSPVEFENSWKNCMQAIGQACKHARRPKQLP
jgi:hypothetical protein